MSASTRERMQADLVDAMKARDAARVSVLRATLAAIANAEAVAPVAVTSRISEVARKDLTDDDIQAIIAAEHAELRRASAEMHALSQTDKADDLATQAAILASYV